MHVGAVGEENVVLAEAFAHSMPADLRESRISVNQRAPRAKLEFWNPVDVAQIEEYVAFAAEPGKPPARHPVRYAVLGQVDPAFVETMRT
jgi:hypothetical protein